MESRASEVLVALKNPNVSVDAKVAAITNLKSDIKQKNVPEAAVPQIFDSLRLAISAQHSSLSSAGFSTLGHLLKRLYIQEFHNLIAFHARQLYPVCLERLGDHKERIRSQAAQAFTDLWTAAPQDVEQHVLGVALVGKNPRAKEASMIWLATMTREHNILFRAHVPSLVTALEDADSGVREAAKNTVIEIFQTAPSRAKSDLKKQLSENGVRKSIVSAILSSLGLSDHDTMSSSRSETRRPGSSMAVSRHRDDPPRPNSVLSARPQSRVGISREDLGPASHATLKIDKFSAGLSHSVSTDSLAASASAAVEDENIEPLDVDSNRDIDDIFRNMSYHFEGRESEQNWIPREKSVETLRRLVRGNAPHSFSQHFLAGIKNLLDGILKVANSLRTTLSTTGCLLIQDIARICGPGIDHMVEMLLQNMIKLCAGMKKISAQNANATVDIIIQNVTYVPRILQHIWFACQDKNTQPRLYATGWLKTLLNKQARHKSSIEHGGGLDVVEKCIKRGLADANPGVRESMRATFWTFYQLWTDRADEIMSTLDSKSRSLLEKDSNNPNGTHPSDNRSRPALSSSVSAPSHRPTLKETIAAQKRAAAAKNAPSRPESSQSSYAEAKPARPTSRPPPASKATSSMRTVPTGAHLSSLSSAPMRPGAKPRRPELARPATADPYSDRRPPSAASHNKTFSPDVSPVRARAKTPTVKSPGRPKSRAGGAPASVSSTTRSKPKRLDIASLKSNDPRVISGAKSDPEDIVQAPLVVDEPFQPHFHEGTQAVERTIGDTSDYATEAVSTTPTEKITASFESQPFINPATQEDTFSGMHISHSRETSLESRGVPSVIASPSPRHSRHSSDDYRSKIPSPVAPRSVNQNEARLVGLRVYEDPEARKSVDETPSQDEESHQPVLGEIPVNEPNTPAPRDKKQITLSPSAHVDNALPQDGSENGHRLWSKTGAGERRRSISPRSKDLTKAKDMIDKGIARIRANALDAHGYRKLQVLIKYHAAIFTDQAKYNEMLVALLDALETANDEKRSSASRSMDLKTQILVTIRLMSAYNETYFAVYYPRVMTSLLNTRKQYESTTSHIVSGLEETAEDIVSSCQPQEVMEAVLDLVETEQNNDEGYRAITMGTYVLSGLLRRLNKYQKKLDDAEIARLGRFGNAKLSQPQPDVRRAVTEFCVELHEMMHDEEAFWRMINSVGNDHRNLLTYFIAKRSSEAIRS